MTENKTPTGLSPSSDPSAQKRRKLLFGKGAVVVISSIAVAAFTLYAVIVLYAIMTAP
ncbi:MULTISPECIES: hypothetical protein [unclassified Rhizobium]|uniref:hypothetical protein n=1 Tax=unclassified Rhizobium TaxID=2613769 RepID=UPI000B03E8F0|nr:MULTISPECIES: hypothetical protein [unclassified Rhizobium]